MRNRKIIAIIGIFLVMIATATPLMAKKPYTPSKYYEIVEGYFNSGDWGEGKSVLDEALDEYPNDRDLLYLAGYYWWHSRDVEKARYYLRRSTLIDHNFRGDAHFLLIDLEESVGDYSAAICYVNEILEVQPYDKTLWLRKIELYRKQGNIEEANNRLRRLNKIFPNDTLVTGEYYAVLDQTIRRARESGDTKAAKEAVQEMLTITPNDVDYQLLYINYIIQEGRYDEALTAINNALEKNPGDARLMRKKLDILFATGKPMLAVETAREAARTHPSGAMNKLYNNTMEEAARIQRESDPYEMYAKIYGKNPGNREALDYLLKTAATKGYYDDALYYLDKAEAAYGKKPKYAVQRYSYLRRLNRDAEADKYLNEMSELYPSDYDIQLEAARLRLQKSAALMADEQYKEAIPLLQQVIDHSPEPDQVEVARRRLANCQVTMDIPERYRRAVNDTSKYAALDSLRQSIRMYPEEKIFVTAHSGISEILGDDLRRQRRNNEALTVLDSALVYDPKNQELIYQKGLVFEQMHQYDSAYYYQSRYIPSPSEAAQYNAHLRTLRSKTYTQNVQVGYHRFRFGDSYTIWALGTASYTRSNSEGLSWTGTVNYTARDGYETAAIPTAEDSLYASGGRGIQGMFDISKRLNDRWTIGGTAAVANKYFPKILAKVTGTLTRPIYTYEFSGQYRYLPDNRHMFSGSAGISRDFDRFNLMAKADAGLLDGIFFVNGMGRVRYYPVYGASDYIEFAAGAGTAPEISVLDYYYAPTAFNHINSFVSLAGGWLIYHNLMMHAGVNWSTLYSEKQDDAGNITVRYRNLFDIHVSLMLSF